MRKNSVVDQLCLIYNIPDFAAPGVRVISTLVNVDSVFYVGFMGCLQYTNHIPRPYCKSQLL